MTLHGKDGKAVDACRFCYMCRHVCPVGMATGQERHNARAHALLLSLVQRGREYTADIAESLFECALCGACTNDCATGFDPVSFIRTARRESFIDCVAPDYAARLAEKALAGQPLFEQAGGEALTAALRQLPKDAETLLYLGSARALCPDAAADAVRVLCKAGVPFFVLPEEPECGAVLLDILGPAEETRALMRQTAETLVATGAKRIICLSPDSARIFLREYREWNLGLGAQVTTFTAAAAELLRQGKITPRKKDLTVTYHDAFMMARDLGETEPPREIIRACADLVEMGRSGVTATACGEGALSLLLPELSGKMAARRMAEACATGAAAVATACPSAHSLLRGTGGLETIAIASLLWKCLETEGADADQT